MKSFALRENGAAHAVWSYVAEAGDFVYTVCGREGHALYASWKNRPCRNCERALPSQHVNPQRVFGWHPDYGGRESPEG